MKGVQKMALHRCINKADGRRFNLRNVASQWIDCCSGRGCGWDNREAAGNGDHMCRITRQRLALRPVTAALPLPKGSYTTSALDAMRQDLGKPLREWSPVAYEVPTARADTLWRTVLAKRRIDLLKIDIDQSWRDSGLEGLVSERAIGVMVIEVDSSWGGVNEWNLTQVDQLAWFARRHGYSRHAPPHAARLTLGAIMFLGPLGAHRAWSACSYLKVPCRLPMRVSEVPTVVEPAERAPRCIIRTRHVICAR